MKGIPFGKRESKPLPPSFDQMVQQLSMYDGQLLLEILNDYYADASCWSEVTRKEKGVRCRWCDGEAESTYRIRHGKNCPIDWLAHQVEHIDDHLAKLPRLRIGRPPRETQIIPEDKLLPGSVEDYVDDGRREARTHQYPEWRNHRSGPTTP